MRRRTGGYSHLEMIGLLHVLCERIAGHFDDFWCARFKFWTEGEKKRTRIDVRKSGRLGGGGVTFRHVQDLPGCFFSSQKSNCAHRKIAKANQDSLMQYVEQLIHSEVTLSALPSRQIVVEGPK